MGFKKSTAVLNKSHYKVTVTLYVEANSPRHAAHIAKGVLQSKDSKVDHFTVEERTLTYGQPYSVNLSKEKGEVGYLEVI
jgi:hypothetical protein